MFTPAASYSFGPFVLDASAYRLVHETGPIALSPRALDLLFLFASRPGVLLTKDGILAELWPDVAVTDNALTQVVSEVRQAIGDKPSTPRYLETVPRRGYRFVATIERLESAAGAPMAGARPTESARRTVAVADFANVTGDRELAWLSAGIAETITNALRGVRDLHIADRPAVRPLTAGGDVMISGSFQRAGDQLRVTAEAVDAGTRESLAQARADGLLADVFRLQDEIVSALVERLHLAIPPVAAARMHARETASLEAYRALTEGRLKLEALDPALVPGAILDFERARDLDPSYALAFVGLAHAVFWRFQASRAMNAPDRTSLAQAIAHARHAVDLDPDLAEGHAALAFFLASADRPREAVAAGRVATALEPANWRHQFRLGVAAWGDERVACFEAVTRVYPQMAYAHFGQAMVEVARGHLDRARRTLESGTALDTLRAADARFPSAGLHWLLGLIHLSSGAVTEAEAAFDREIARTGRDLFAAEFAMDAWNGRGFARLAADDDAGAIAMFERALEHVPGHARSLLGLADAHRRQGHRAAADEVMARAREAIEALRSHERHTEAAMATACGHALSGRSAEATLALEELLAQAPPGQAGWTIPVEPFTRVLRGAPGLQTVLDALAARAR
jgi:DNA-binding winged helix-turn-helix (wHTH) protein/tetratricopeptide (TPR) repeat protein